MSLILTMLLTASTSVAPKEYFAIDPMLSGSIIKYCEHNTPKACRTIDRRKEAITLDLASITGQLVLELSEVAPQFHTLTVDFVKSDKVPGSLDMQFKFTQDPKKKPVKE